MCPLNELGNIDSFDDQDDSPDEAENFLERTYVCEECGFRWTERIYPERSGLSDYEDEFGGTHCCPMCGSSDVSFY